MKRLASPLLLYVVVGLAYGQNTLSPATIVGRVSPVVRLTLGPQSAPTDASPPNGLTIVTSADQIDSILVFLNGTGAGAPAQLTLPLEIRSNVAHEMTLTLISTEGCAPTVNASIGSVRVGGPWVAPGAAAVSHNKVSIDLLSCRSPVMVLRGPRVSIGGNFTSPGNALAADLNIAVSEDVASQCPWRVLFRVSVHPSS